MTITAPTIQDHESQMLAIADYHKIMNEKGWVTFPSFLDNILRQQLCDDMLKAYDKCRSIQIKNGLEENTDGTVHHVLIFEKSFLALLEYLSPLMPYLEDYFDGPCILNSFGGVVNKKDAPAYVANIHRDVRSFTGNLPLMINMMVILDEFTEEKGATYILSGSHQHPEKPEEHIFYQQADRVIAPAGSVVLFNSNLWHAAGVNRTDLPRRLLTLTFTKPFMKPQLDYPRALGFERMEDFSPHLQQLIGYKARIPSTLEEWYQPLEKRFYQKGQG